MTDEEQVMEIKLALVGIGIWSTHEYCKNAGLQSDGPGQYAVVKLETIHKSGKFFWDDIEGKQFFKTRTQAMEYALKRLLVST